MLTEAKQTWEVEDDRFAARQRQVALEHLLKKIPTRYRSMTWETWVTSNRADAKAEAEVRAWQEAESKVRPWALLVFGKPGTGKTHLALASFRSLVEPMDLGQLRSAMWTDAAALLTGLQAFFGKSTAAADFIRDASRASILFLDDLGAEHATPWSKSTLAQILRERYSWMLPTIVTTNGNRDALSEWDERVADRIWSADAVVVGRGGDSRRGVAR